MSIHFISIGGCIMHQLAIALKRKKQWTRLYCFGFYSTHATKMKRLAPLDKENVKNRFARRTLQVFDQKEELQH